MSTDHLLRQGEKLWDRIRKEHPKLETTIELQRQLVTQVIEIVRVLEENSLPKMSLGPAYIISKLARGTPVLRGEVVPIPVSVLSPFIVAFCNQMAHGGVGEVALHVRDSLKCGRIDIGSLLHSSLERDQDAIRIKALHLDLSPDLVWLVAEMSVGPLAHILQHRFLFERGNQTTDHDVAQAVKVWDRGYCPACGSWPALAETYQNRRVLRCSFCGSDWQLSTSRCTYCQESAEKFVIDVPDAKRPERRLELCGNCQGYLKCIELVDATPFTLLPTEDLASSNLDAVATDRGYIRPSLSRLEMESAEPCQ